MKIVETYSHLNGLEFLLVHRPALWSELQAVVAQVDAGRCKTKISREKTMPGKVLYSPIAMNQAFKVSLGQKGWKESRGAYWVTKNAGLIRQTLALPADAQKRQI